MSTRDRMREAKENFDIWFIDCFPPLIDPNLRNFLRNMGHRIIDLLTEALEGEKPDEDRFERLLNALAGSKECMDDLNRKCSMLVQEYQELKKQFQPKPAPAEKQEIEKGDEVWIPAKVLELAGEDVIVGVNFSNLLIPKDKIRKKE